MLRVKKPQDLGAAAIFIVIGVAGLWFGREYQVGTAARMGPGYFPMVLSWMLIVFGLIVGAGSFVFEGPPVSLGNLRGTILVLISIFLFGLLIESAGLAIATFVVTAVAAFASPESKWKEYIPLGAFLAIACVLVFIYGLKQAIPAFPDFSAWF